MSALYALQIFFDGRGCLTCPDGMICQLGFGKSLPRVKPGYMSSPEEQLATLQQQMAQLIQTQNEATSFMQRLMPETENLKPNHAADTQALQASQELERAKMGQDHQEVLSSLSLSQRDTTDSLEAQQALKQPANEVTFNKQ